MELVDNLTLGFATALTDPELYRRYARVLYALAIGPLAQLMLPWFTVEVAPSPTSGPTTAA